MTQVTERLSANTDRYAGYRADYERLRKENAPLYLHQLRKNGMRRFSELGMPITRELEFPLREEWIYTNVAPIASTNYAFAFDADASSGLTRDDLAPYRFDGTEWTELVFVNGRFDATLSRILPMPSGVVAANIDTAHAECGDILQRHLGQIAGEWSSGFTALNTAFIRDGACVYIPDGQMVERPIHALYISTERPVPGVAHPRTLIVVGNGASATVVESYIGLSGQNYFTNAVSEIVAGPDASLDHYRINRENREACHISSTHARLEQNSHVATFNLSMGGALTRNDTTAFLAGEHAAVRMNGLYLTTGEQHVDNHTAITHAAPSCDSFEVYKGILEGRSRAVFNGKVFVHKQAQETDAKQLNKNLLLSPDATVHTKPQLEILADQVKCTHGATVGQLDEEQIFYLRTRGLSRDAACHLLTYGFAGDLIRRLRVPAIRQQLDSLFETTIQQLAMAQSQV